MPNRPAAEDAATVVSQIFSKASDGEKDSGVAAAFKAVYDQGAWTPENLSTALEKLVLEKPHEA